MKRLIFIFGGIDTTDQSIEQMILAAQTRGIEYMEAHPERGVQEMVDQIVTFSRAGNCAAITNNNACVMFPDESGSFWTQIGVPIYNILVDHPRNYYECLDNKIPMMCVVCIDRHHERFIREYYPNVKRTCFVPLGGTEISAGKPWTERETDILLLAGHHEGPPWRTIPWLSDGGKSLYEKTLENLLIKPQLTLEQASHEAANSLGIHPDHAQWKNLFEDYLQACEVEARRQYKETIIRQLSEAGLSIEIYGGHWGNLADLPGIHVHGRIPVWDCLALTGNAKIVLNIMPWFKEGAHDRIFTGMLNGAVSVTDTSEYLLERYTHGKDIVFYELTNLPQLTEHLNWLLSHPNEAARIALTGQMKAWREDTWGSRLDALLEIMEEKERL